MYPLYCEYTASSMPLLYIYVCAVYNTHICACLHRKRSDKLVPENATLPTRTHTRRKCPISFPISRRIRAAVHTVRQCNTTSKLLLALFFIVCYGDSYEYNTYNKYTTYILQNIWPLNESKINL